MPKKASKKTAKKGGKGRKFPKKASKKTAKKGGKGRKFPKLPGGTVTLLTPKVDKPLHLVLLPR